MRVLRAGIGGFIIAAILCTQVPQPLGQETVKIIEVPIYVNRNVPVYMAEPSRGGGRTMEVTATAYTYSKDSEDITFSGLPVDVGIIAVDPDVIPLGSLCYVEGYGYAIAADTGNRDYIGGHRIDVFLPTKALADKWGVKKVTIKVIR